MKKLVTVILAVLMLLSITAPTANAYFQDVDKNNWAANYISYAEAYGLINGIGDGKFNPNGTLTEAQCCQIIYNNLASNATQSTGKYWYKDAVNWIQQRWNVNISPDSAATRLFVCELVTEFGPPKAPVAKTDTMAFNDCNSLTQYERYAIGYCWQAGIIDGYPDGTFKPYGKLTRAEGAKIFAIWHRQENGNTTPDPAKAMTVQQKAKAQAETMAEYAKAIGWNVEVGPWPYNHDDGTYWYRLKVTHRKQTEEFLVGGATKDTEVWWYYEGDDGFDFLDSRDSVKSQLQLLK